MVLDKNKYTLFLLYFHVLIEISINNTYVNNRSIELKVIIYLKLLKIIFILHWLKPTMTNSINFSEYQL